MRSFLICRTDLLLIKEYSVDHSKQNEIKAGHVARLRDKRNACRVVLIVKGRSALEDVGNIILKWTSKIMDGRLWSGVIRLM